MSVVEIIGLDASTYVRTVLMACIEKNIPHRLNPEPIGERGSALKSPAYLALNPYGRMPVMRHDGFELFETTAILRYLEGRFGGSSRLIPADPKKAAIAEQWASAINFSAYRALIVHYLFHYIFPKGPDGTPDRAAIEADLPVAQRELEILECGLASGTFFCGEEPTMPDFLLAPILEYVRRRPEGGAAMAKSRRLTRFMKAFDDRQSFGVTLPEQLKRAAE